MKTKSRLKWWFKFYPDYFLSRFKVLNPSLGLIFVGATHPKNEQKFHLQNLQQLIYSVLKWLQSVIKRKADVTQW